MADLTTQLSKFLNDLMAGKLGVANAIASIVVGNGTAAAPSYAFASDPSVGILKPGFAQIGVSLGGAPVRFAFDGSGTLYNLNLFDNQLVWGTGSGNNYDIALVRDAAATLALKNGTNAQTFRVYGTTTGPKYLSLAHDGTNGVIDTAATSGLLSLAPTNATSVSLGKSISSYNGVATAGFGVPPITASYETTGNTGALTNVINYTPAAAASTYKLEGVVNVTAWTTPASFTVTAGYTDASGTARTDTAMVIRGSNGATAAAVTAIDRWYFVFPAIDINNAGVAITLSTAGTFTGSPVYNLQGTLSRVR